MRQEARPTCRFSRRPIGPVGEIGACGQWRAVLRQCPRRLFVLNCFRIQASSGAARSAVAIETPLRQIAVVEVPQHFFVGQRAHT